MPIPKFALSKSQLICIIISACFHTRNNFPPAPDQPGSRQQAAERFSKSQPPGKRGESEEMRYIFKAEKIVFEDQPGYMLYQYSGNECIVSQFIRAEEFENFLIAARINQSEIVFL